MINKKLILSTVLAGTTIFMSGCAVRPTHAMIYTNTQSPYMATNVEAKATKVGMSEKCANYFGIIATGDCSIKKAKENGGIKSVSTVDWEGVSFLGIYTSGRTVVTGN